MVKLMQRNVVTSPLEVPSGLFPRVFWREAAAAFWHGIPHAFPPSTAECGARLTEPQNVRG